MGYIRISKCSLEVSGVVIDEPVYDLGPGRSTIGLNQVVSDKTPKEFVN